jgi:hypothetical protein
VAAANRTRREDEQPLEIVRVGKPHTSENKHDLGGLLHCLLGVKADCLDDNPCLSKCVRGLLVTGRLRDQERGVLVLFRTRR